MSWYSFPLVSISSNHFSSTSTLSSFNEMLKSRKIYSRPLLGCCRLWNTELSWTCHSPDCTAWSGSRAECEPCSWEITLNLLADESYYPHLISTETNIEGGFGSLRTPRISQSRITTKVARLVSMSVPPTEPLGSVSCPPTLRSPEVQMCLVCYCYYRTGFGLVITLSAGVSE